jgi:hypothetical protein
MSWAGHRQAIGAETFHNRSSRLNSEAPRPPAPYSIWRVSLPDPTAV